MLEPVDCDLNCSTSPSEREWNSEIEGGREEGEKEGGGREGGEGEMGGGREQNLGDQKLDH